MPTLLIIRPSNRPKQDIQTCHAAGWQAQVLSPIEIEADRSALNKLPEQFKQADVVFWVSPTAIETAAPHLNFSDGPKAHITVGQTSQHTLAQFSPYPVFSPEDGNDSEAVLRMPIWKNLPPNARVLIIRGHGGRDFLAEKLTELGFQIDIAEIYFRRPHAIDWQSFKTEDIAAAYVELSRNTPLLVQLFFIYFGLPRVGIKWSGETCAIVGLIFLGGAYMAEALRSGLDSIATIQWESASALGLTRTQTLRHVALPQAIATSVPPLAANVIFLIKETSVVSVVALPDLVYVAKDLIGMSYNTSEALILLVLAYLVILLPVSIAARLIEKKVRRGGFGN